MPTLLPDLRQLRTFLAIADEGNFTSAAQKLTVTQSAVSHSMRALEDWVGCKLLERTGKSNVATEEGEILLKRSRSAFRELKKAQRELDGLRVWGQQKIRIGAPHSLFEFLLPTVLREFQEYFPNCEPQLEAGNTEELLERLAEEELDIAFGLLKNDPPGENYLPLFKDRIAFVVAPHHPWAETGLCDPAELPRMQYVMYARAPETRATVEENLRRLGLQLHHPLVVNETGALKELIKIELGVGIVAPWVARRELEQGSLVEIKLPGEPIERQWGLFTSADRKSSPVEETFIEIAQMAGRLLEFE